MKRVVLIGRPNVGKSTLFNRLTGGRHALVDDREGVTRDYMERPWRIENATVELVDLCGYRPEEPDLVLRDAQANLEPIWQGADLLLFVVDARAGATQADRWIAERIRRTGVEVVLVANKVESESVETFAWGVAELGWSPHMVSAEHGLGVAELEEAVAATLFLDGRQQTAPVVAPERPLDIAILGKPNVGKSTLLNRFLAKDRATVSEVAGTTMDPVEAVGRLGSRTVRFVDTAGIRRKRSVTDGLEHASVTRSLKAAEDADLVLYLIRGDEGISQQDQTLLGMLHERNIAVLLLLSQWDRVADPDEMFRHFLLERERQLQFMSYVPAITISCLSGHGVGRVAKWTDMLADQFDRTVETARLNRILEALLAENPPPAVQIRRSRRTRIPKRLKIYYATQTGTRPPRFRLFVNLRDVKLPTAYHRYLQKRLREELELPHVPIALEVRGKPARTAE